MHAESFVAQGSKYKGVDLSEPVCVSLVVCLKSETVQFSADRCRQRPNAGPSVSRSN